MSLLSVSSSFRKPKQAAEQTTRLSGDLQENRSFVFFSILISRNLMFYVAAVRERRPSNSEFQPLQRGTSSTAAKQHVYVFDFSLRHVTPTQCRPPPPHTRTHHPRTDIPHKGGTALRGLSSAPSGDEPRSLPPRLLRNVQQLECEVKFLHARS